ncbi:type II secretion system secretin GspD [Spectribacter hydrogenoxidans]|uniref:Type II secretion system secretin GspD n=1 Tax=Spectribacter hydrogenoxidans TaxID=3075608 RepID=A0ABU3C3S0_9GAMM|nr:type II secretion system secretin GspD [Salinisphaera sp. W335]MDT0636206.1 type II secretion system secretin GspD [Salinisphaera sp. W335]
MKHTAPSIFLTLLLTLGISASVVAQQTPEGIEAVNGESFTLNFKEADITALVATVSEVTGRNFVVDPRVKGQITVLSAEPMTPDELYETFLSVLEVHGFSAIPAGEVTKIVPQVNAKQDGGFGGDTATREDIITRVIQVDNVPADQLVPILRPLVPQYGHLAAYPASNILIISDRQTNADRLVRLVGQIDREGNRDIERVQLDNATATEVVQVITQLKGEASKEAPSADDFSVVADERTNSVIIAGDPSSRLRLRAIIADLDTPVDQDGGTQVIYLDYADAETLAPILQTFAENQSEQGNRGGNNTASQSASINVIAEPGANAIVVNAPADAMREIRSVIDQLDIRRGQVLVEAIIAEVSIDRSRQLGIDTAVFDDNTAVAGSILDNDTLEAIPALAGNGTPLGLIQQGLNFGIGDLNSDGTSFAVLLKALSGDSNTNVLSTPSLLTRDNEEAEIQVGQEVPFITGNFTNTGTGGGGTGGNLNPFQTVERRDVGLTLTLTPQINAGNTIQLTLAQEISSIAQGTSGAVDLITNQRTLNTSVEVENGQILVLGGLIDDNLTESEQKVPILGDIPLLGALFRSREVERSKRNLLNFIRPTILRGDGAAGYYTRKKYNYMRNLQQEQQKTGIPLMPDDARPQLPPIERYEDIPVFPDGNGAEGAESSVPQTGNDIR